LESDDVAAPRPQDVDAVDLDVSGNLGIVWDHFSRISQRRPHMSRGIALRLVGLLVSLDAALGLKSDGILLFFSFFPPQQRNNWST